MTTSKDQIIAEIRRVADHLNVESVSMTVFERYGKISSSYVSHVFGSWNRAVQEAGLTPHPCRKSGGKSISPYADEDLLQEIIRLTKELGKEPTEGDMDSHGIATAKPYERRWGSFARAREQAYLLFGAPTRGEHASAIDQRAPGR